MSLAKDPLLQMEVSAIDKWLNVLPTLSQTFLQQMDELDAKNDSNKCLVEPSKEVALLNPITPKQWPDLDTCTGFVTSPSEANQTLLKQILDEGHVESPKEVALLNRIPSKPLQDLDTCSDFETSPTDVSQHQHNHARRPSTLDNRGSRNKRRKCLSGVPFELRTSPKFKGNLGEIPQRIDGGRSYHTFSTSGESFNSLKRVAIQRLSDLKDKGTPKETKDFQAQQELIRNIEMDELERIQMDTLLKHPNHSY